MESQFLKKTICLVFLMMLITVSSAAEISATVQGSSSFSSYGAISYSTPTLPLSVLGDDYLCWNNWNGLPSYWNNIKHFFTEYNCNTARLSFSFPSDTGQGKDSDYSKTKLQGVLDIFNTVGVKVILCEFASSGSHRYGTQQWVNDWKQVATDFAGNSRIKAFQFINEPYENYLDPSCYTTDGLNAALASLINQVRAIDPTRTIMMPIEQWMIPDNPNWSMVWNSMVAHGIPAKGNILYDVVHPYYAENEWDEGRTPTEAADWYMAMFVDPAINSVGASSIWCGETFAHDPKSGYTQSKQSEFEIRLFNNLLARNVGFQVWCFFSSTNQQDQINNLKASEYYTRYG